MTHFRHLSVLIKVILVFSYLFFISLPEKSLAAQIRTAGNASALRSAVNGASPGDVVVITNGTHTPGTIAFTSSGTARNPIRIVPESPGGVVFTGLTTFVFEGDYIELDGIEFRNGRGVKIHFHGGSHNTVSNCIIDDISDARLFHITANGSNDATFNSIMNCTISNIRGFTGSIMNQRHNDTEGYNIGTYFANNVVTNVRATGNLSHIMYIGNNRDGATVDSRIVIENNRFSNITSINEVSRPDNMFHHKASGIVHRCNVFDDVPHISLRQGDNSVFEKNTFTGMTGIGVDPGVVHVRGANMRIIDNIFLDSDGLALELPYGSGVESGENHYQTPTNTLIQNNVFGRSSREDIRLGGSKNRDSETGPRDVAPQGTIIRNNIFDRSQGNAIEDLGSTGTVISGNTFSANISSLVSNRGANHPSCSVPIGPGGGGGTSTSGPCSLYQSGNSAPSPYGLSWDWTTTQRDLLLKVTCESGGSRTVNMGNGRETGSGSNKAGLTYVYHQGYWNDGSKSWTPYNLTCNGSDTTKVANAWCKGSATASLPSQAKWFVGYSCIWSGSQWQCGCTDSSCTGSYWQIQGVK